MRLTTVQPYEVLESLRSSGRFVCDITKSSLASGKDCVFRAAYNWLVQKMEERIGPAPIGVKYPIWAWYRNDDNYVNWYSDGRKYAKITIDIDSSRVVLSDYDDWHRVLNNSPLLNSAIPEEDYDAEWDRCVAAGSEAVRATWEQVFRSDCKYVQATFWELYLSDVVGVEVFVSRHMSDDELD